MINGRLWYRTLLLGSQTSVTYCETQSTFGSNDPIGGKFQYDGSSNTPRIFATSPPSATIPSIQSFLTGVGHDRDRITSNLQQESKGIERRHSTKRNAESNNSINSTKKHYANEIKDIDANNISSDGESNLPFPRDTVGNYTCHGIEPAVMRGPTPPGREVGVDKITGVSYVMSKINQDRAGVISPYGSNNRTALFSVYDGHGRGGEELAQHTMLEVEKRLQIHPDFENDISNAFKETFLDIDKGLKEELNVDPSFCGSTACLILVRDKTLHIANVGDSRAILCRRHMKGSSQRRLTMVNKEGAQNKPRSFRRKALVLTEDQKPDLPTEQKRIEKAGGFVSPSPEPGISARVWVDKGGNYLGLAMSRSVGDLFLKEAGVIVEPVVTTYEVDPSVDEFIVMASDGVWEYIGSDEAVRIVGRAMDNGASASEACEQLIRKAAVRWKKYDYDYRDDITAIVVKLGSELFEQVEE